MQYNLEAIEYVKAIKLSGKKTDVQAQVTIKLKEAIATEARFKSVLKEALGALAANFFTLRF